MVYVSRITRIKRYLKHAPRHLFNKYPEQFVGYSTFGVVSVCIATWKLWGVNVEGYKPWYRGRYDVVRPDDPRALNWRTPEQYPAAYETNRQNNGYKTVARDYGYNLKH